MPTNSGRTDRTAIPATGAASPPALHRPPGRPSPQEPDPQESDPAAELPPAVRAELDRREARAYAAGWQDAMEAVGAQNSPGKHSCDRAIRPDR